jgi:Holliday junction resolvase RusA-like endonuclease
VAKGRAKTAVRGKFAVHYTPDKTRNAEQSLLAQALPYKPDMPWSGAIGLEVEAIFVRPKNHYRTGCNSHLLKDDAPEFHIIKPDRDNLEKLISDALDGVFFINDCQIVGGEIRKSFGEVAGLKIWLWKYSGKRRRFEGG